MIEQIAFVRLVPTDLPCGDSAQVQSAYVWGREQPSGEFGVVRDGGDD